MQQMETVNQWIEKLEQAKYGLAKHIGFPNLKPTL